MLQRAYGISPRPGAGDDAPLAIVDSAQDSLPLRSLDHGVVAFPLLGPLGKKLPCRI